MSRGAAEIHQPTLGQQDEASAVRERVFVDLRLDLLLLNTLVGLQIGDLNLDVGAFTTCLLDSHYVGVLERDIQDAKDRGISAVPSVFINGRRVLGLSEYGVYRDIIDQELMKDQ